MTAKIGPADRIAESDLLRRLLTDYGIAHPTADTGSDFVLRHIAQLEAVENEVAARTGFVLKRAHEGFGLGYKVPLVVLAMGRAMLGLDLAVAAPFIAANPVAFTCASVGAVYYGYHALSTEEQQALLEKIGSAFDFGVEIVRGIARFCIDAISSLLSSDLLSQLKSCVAEVATSVGSSLYEVTGSVKDRLAYVASSAAGSVGWLASSAGGAVGAAASSAATAMRSLVKESSSPPDESAQ